MGRFFGCCLTDKKQIGGPIQTATQYALVLSHFTSIWKYEALKQSLKIYLLYGRNICM